MARVFAVVGLVVLAAGVPRGPPSGARRDVVTSQGIVRGYGGGPSRHFAYLGIPYGGSRGRFKSPTSPPHWEGIFEATHRVRCPQAGGGDVNCLVVNVFVPEDQPLMPVMVYFHSGGFHSGWGLHQPPQRLIKQGVITVTFNYRLGALGFLCLGTEEAPGNAGLKDQVAALYWVQRNIANFGGDPAAVTVYGTGAGASAIQLLILSGAANNLFNRVILESGSAVAPETIMYDPVLVASETAVLLGMSRNSSWDDFIKFYKSHPYSKLTNYSSTFRPCIENQGHISINLLENDPMEILYSGSFKNIPIMFVYTNLEGLSFIGESFDPTLQDFYYLLPNELEFEDQYKKAQIADITEEFYIGHEESTKDGLLKHFIDYFSDVLVLYPMLKSAIQHAERSSMPVYLMEFSFNGSLNSPKFIELPGAIRGDIFNYIFSRENLDDDDELTASRMATLWANFIRFGDPTPLTTTLLPVMWQPISIQGNNKEKNLLSANYLSFNKNLVATTTSNKTQLVFWERMYSKFFRRYVDIEEEYRPK